jgi:hypothetical protein
MKLRAALDEGTYVLDEDPLASQDYICSLEFVKIRFIQCACEYICEQMYTDVYRCVQMCADEELAY